MSIDWTSIIISLGGCAGFVAVIELVRDWKDKKKKNTVEVQDSQIDLGSKFVKMASELGDMISTGNKDVLDGVNNLRDEVSNIVSYLNGGYQDFLHKKEEDGEK